MDALERWLTGMSVSGVNPEGILVPDPNQRLVPGTTSPLLAVPYIQSESGLLVPASTQQPLQPIDLIGQMITYKDLVGVEYPASMIPGLIAKIDRLHGVVLCADLIRRLDSSNNLRELYESLAAMALPEPMRLRALTMIRQGGYALLAPQVLQLLLRQLLLNGADGTHEDANVQQARLFHAYFALADLLPETPQDTAGTPLDSAKGQLSAEVVANQSFHEKGRVRPLLSGHLPRWAAYETFDPTTEFFIRTGVEHRRLEIVTVLLMAAAQADGSPLLARLRVLGQELASDVQAQMALDMLAIDLDKLRPLLVRENARPDSAWVFDAFERWPVIKWNDDDLLVISPRLLAERVFSWAAVNDLRDANQNLPKPIERHLTCAAEERVRAVLESLCPQVLGKSIYTDVEQGLAFRTSRRSQPRTADFAVDCPSEWLVVEVTTTRPRRDTVHGTPASDEEEAFEKDIAKLTKKARQLESSIAQLRLDESRLTGQPSRPRQFIPVLVCTEGFPVNPITCTSLKERLKKGGLLQDPDTLPVRLLSATDLEAAEAVCEDRGTTLTSILERHAMSTLRDASLLDFLSNSQGGASWLPNRLTPRIHSFFTSIRDELESIERGSQT